MPVSRIILSVSLFSLYLYFLKVEDLRLHPQRLLLWKGRNHFLPSHLPFFKSLDSNAWADKLRFQFTSWIFIAGALVMGTLFTIEGFPKYLVLINIVFILVGLLTVHLNLTKTMTLLCVRLFFIYQLYDLYTFPPHL
jgi:hypothetical protein